MHAPGGSVQLRPAPCLLTHPACTWISFCSGKPLRNAAAPGCQQPCWCPAKDARAAPLPRCRGPAGLRAGRMLWPQWDAQLGALEAERSFSVQPATPGVPTASMVGAPAAQPCRLDQLPPTTQLPRKPLSEPFPSKNNSYKYFPKQTRPTARYSPKKLSKAGSRLQGGTGYANRAAVGSCTQRQGCI